MLTGRYYFKQTMLGLVLMLEYKEIPQQGCDSCYYSWVKAHPSDIVDLNIKMEAVVRKID